jgi:hypothetical protein
VYAGIAQLVERNLAKVEVAGSNPVSRSNLYHFSYNFFGKNTQLVGRLVLNSAVTAI